MVPPISSENSPAPFSSHFPLLETGEVRNQGWQRGAGGAKAPRREGEKKPALLPTGQLGDGTGERGFDPPAA